MFGGNIHLFLELLEGNDSHVLSAMELQLEKSSVKISGHPSAGLVVVVLMPGLPGARRSDFIAPTIPQPSAVFSSLASEMLHLFG